MNTPSLFQKYWSKFRDKDLEDRQSYFYSLSGPERRHLVKSFFEEGWHELVIQNIIGDHLDFIKQTYEIDIIDLRLKCTKHGMVRLVERRIWDHVNELIYPYADYYDTDMLFGGLEITPWGKHLQFYRISS